MKLLFVIFTLMFMPLLNLAQAKTFIVFVDMEKIINISKPGASVLKQLNKLNKANMIKFKKIEETLKEKEKKLSAQKNILSSAEFQNTFSKLKLEVEKYNKDRSKTINEFKKIQFDNKVKLIELINPILADYSNKNSIDVILKKESVLVAKTELDITDLIIVDVNKKLKEFKIK
tara:strand:+ start:1113 stop:1634 length:522 start_codon:yes stop_codon:yes gene_type:complete